MARSDYDIYHVLQTWQDIMREDNWRFNQVLGTGVPTQPQKAYDQYQRDEIAQTLTPAFDAIADILHTFLKPTYWVDTTINLRKGVPYYLQDLNLSWRNLIALGERNSSLIEAGVMVVYSDTTGNGVNDTATVTVTTAVDVDEVQLFPIVADGAPTVGDEFYRIEPLTAVRSGADVILTGHRALFVKPSEWAKPYDPADANSLNVSTIDPTQATGFVATVDVYRVFTDATSAVTLIADPIFTEGEGSWDSDKEYTGQGYIRDAEAGIIRVRQNSSCPVMIHAAKVKYLSGTPLQNGVMDLRLSRAMVYLANTYFPVNLACPMADRTQTTFSDNRQTVTEGVPPSMINNPFGVIRGQIEAWRIVSQILTRTRRL